MLRFARSCCCTLCCTLLAVPAHEEIIMKSAESVLMFPFNFAAWDTVPFYGTAAQEALSKEI